MANYTIKAPNGQTYSLTGPDGATQQQVEAEVARQHPEAVQAAPSGPPSDGIAGSFLRGASTGASAGWADKLRAAAESVIPASVLNAGQNMVTGGLPILPQFNPQAKTVWQGGSLPDVYAANRGVEQAQTNSDANAHPIANIAGNVAGGFALPIAGEAGVAGRLAQAAGYGASYGAGQSQADTYTGQAQDAFGGAAGGLIGGALGEGVARAVPAIGSAISNQFGNAEGRAVNLISSRLAADHLDPQSAAGLMQAGQQNGVPTTLADLGPNMQMLGGSVSRQPGAARDIAVNFTQDRQLGQGERIQDAIGRDLGPTNSDLYTASDALMQQAKTAAAPLYDAFHALPARTNDAVDELLKTPAGKSALANARTIALNDRVDPNKLGITLNDQGEPALTKTPSPQTLDYVKQALDDSLEQYRNPMTGKLNLTPMGRSINGVRADLVNQMDTLYPNDYAAARQAYAGPAQLRDALWDGKNAVNQSAAQINQRLQNMSDPEKDQYALGFRSALSDGLNRMGDSTDKVKAIIGTPQKRAALQQVFGSDSDVRATCGHARPGTVGPDRLICGSTPGRRRKPMPWKTRRTQTPLPMASRRCRPLRAGKTGLVRYGLNKAEDAMNFGIGNAGQRAREQTSSMLFSPNPNDFLGATIKAQAARASRAASVNALAGKVATGGRQLGAATPNALGIQDKVTFHKPSPSNPV